MTKVLRPAQPCPCTSGQRYDECCRPLHRGEAAATAVRLMRSRFSAFAIGDVDYLDATQHPEHVDQARPREERRRSLSAFCRSARFPGLQIVDSLEAPRAAPDGDGDGDGDGQGDAFVLFVARVFVGGRDQRFMECSRFRRHEGAWRYLDGDLEADRRIFAGIGSIQAFSTRAQTIA